MDEIYTKLNAIFRDFFDDESIVVDENTVSGDIEGWDSLEHITLLSVIENEFDISFDLKKSTKYQNVGELAAELERQSGK